MIINERRIPVKEVYNGYHNSQIDGVVGYGGKLDIRPKFQREFVYDDVKREAVINTIFRGLPLNVMYWTQNEGDTYELLDGQQRTISVCQYIQGDFSYKSRYFHNLTRDEQEKILNYDLFIYTCNGTDSEKLEWFRIINISGVQLTDQELRNAVYSGPWLSDAKRYFSKPGCPAVAVGGDYLGGSMIRQDYLETAIKWVGDKENETIEEYMAKRQHNTSATDLWLYFKAVIDWVKAYYTRYDKRQKGIEWGLYYNKYKNVLFNPAEIDQEVRRLMKDEEVQKKSGIFKYLLDGQERHLNLRGFEDSIKRTAFERQAGVCAKCRKTFTEEQMEADHITPWSQGGKTTLENCQMLCKTCNRTKSDI